MYRETGLKIHGKTMMTCTVNIHTNIRTYFTSTNVQINNTHMNHCITVHLKICLYETTMVEIAYLCLASVNMIGIAVCTYEGDTFFGCLV